MARRGFFAEIQYQARLEAQKRERADRESLRLYAAAVREAERAKKASERAQTQLGKAEDAERKRLEKEAREAHIANMEAEVVQRNRQLEQIYSDIDSLLTCTLEVDDYVELESLRAIASQPTFDRTDLEVPVPVPPPILDPKEPLLDLPKPPSGLASFFGKKKHAEAVANAHWIYEQAMNEWRNGCRNMETARLKAKEEHEQAEERRLVTLEAERKRYTQECAARELDVIERNNRLDELIANLGYGTTEAIQEYISIVLSNSVYPEHFQVVHEFEFDPLTAELQLRVFVPGPSDIPKIKLYKYTKSSDEITSTALSQKECRDRYAGAIHQVALRSLHEVFESDRRGLIKTIAIEVGAETIDPATGQQIYVPFVIAGAERETFLAFDLSAVVPVLTLGRLGAAVSKNPSDLVAAERAGVRRS
jgi:restriction system protein